MTGHLLHCARWEYVAGSRELSMAKICNCGYADYLTAQKHQSYTANRPLTPLGMSDDDFLRTMRIEPL